MALWDPRLNNPVLLALAAQRVRHRQAQPPLPDWEQVEGLCALLDYAARCGGQDLSAVDDADLPTTSFTALLIEARAMQRAQEQEGET